MNWGNRLVLVFIVFAALIGTLVYKSMHTKFELVSKDYYTDELRYQEKINGKANAAKRNKVTVIENADSIIINLPLEEQPNGIRGEAWFYCSSNAVNDRKIKLMPAMHNRQAIFKKELVTGSYQLNLSWQDGLINYYDEKMITIH